jgi:tRNA-dihydrouridine synthase
MPPKKRESRKQRQRRRQREDLIAQTTSLQDAARETDLELRGRQKADDAGASEKLLASSTNSMRNSLLSRNRTIAATHGRVAGCPHATSASLFCPSFAPRETRCVLSFASAADIATLRCLCRAAMCVGAVRAAGCTAGGSAFSGGGSGSGGVADTTTAYDLAATPAFPALSPPPATVPPPFHAATASSPSADPLLPAPLPDFDRIPIDADAHAARAWQLYNSVLGAPRFVCAPMVRQSELAFRMLTRRRGVDICYTPMMSACALAQCGPGDDPLFTSCKEDRPLVVQVWCKSPECAVAAAKALVGRCEAMDINLGCPQSCAMIGHYGSFLLQDPLLVCRMVRRVAVEVPELPIFCKIRLLPTLERTVTFARMLERAGCSLLAVHGRQPWAKRFGEPDAMAVKAVRESIRIPLVFNGGVTSMEEAERFMAITGACAAMSATSLLENPRLFDQGEVGGNVQEGDQGAGTGTGTKAMKRTNAAEGAKVLGVAKAKRPLASPKRPPPPHPVALALEYLDFAARYPPDTLQEVRNANQKVFISETERVIREHIRCIFRPWLKEAGGQYSRKLWQFMAHPKMNTTLQYHEFTRLIAHHLGSMKQYIEDGEKQSGGTGGGNGSGSGSGSSGSGMSGSRGGGGGNGGIDCGGEGGHRAGYDSKPIMGARRQGNKRSMCDGAAGADARQDELSSRYRALLARLRSNDAPSPDELARAKAALLEAMRLPSSASPNVDADSSFAANSLGGESKSFSVAPQTKEAKHGVNSSAVAAGGVSQSAFGVGSGVGSGLTPPPLPRDAFPAWWISTPPPTLADIKRGRHPPFYGDDNDEDKAGDGAGAISMMFN